MKKVSKFLIMFLAIGLLFTACADVTPLEQCATTEPSGFFSGLLHGFIIWFSFIGSLFSDSIAVYDVNNTGGWYDCGFMLGLGAFTGGGSSVTKKN